MNRSFKVGDMVRISKIPPHIMDPAYPFPEVLQAFEFALGNVYRVEFVDWGGWVQLQLDREHGGIGVHPIA